MTDIATQKPAGALAMPDFLKDVKGTAGTEHITKADLQLPRLALAQGLTPQVVEGKEGFNIGVLFNSMTNEVYGRGPIDFCIVRADKPRWVEFIPRDQGGGVKDMDVKEGDPRTRFRNDVVQPDGSKKNLPPIATKFYDFIIQILAVNDKPFVVENPMDAIIALSFKSTGIPVAKLLNTLVKMRNKPIIAGNYRLTTGAKTNPKGTFAVYKVENSPLNNGWAANVEELTARQAMFDSLKERAVVIDREPGSDDDPDSFNPADIEASATSSDM